MNTPYNYADEPRQTLRTSNDIQANYTWSINILNPWIGLKSLFSMQGCVGNNWYDSTLLVQCIPEKDLFHEGNLIESCFVAVLFPLLLFILLQPPDLP